MGAKTRAAIEKAAQLIDRPGIYCGVGLRAAPPKKKNNVTKNSTYNLC